MNFSQLHSVQLANSFPSRKKFIELSLHSNIADELQPASFSSAGQQFSCKDGIHRSLIAFKHC
jgi:hypothetical protein